MKKITLGNQLVNVPKLMRLLLLMLVFYTPFATSEINVLTSIQPLAMIAKDLGQ